MVMKYLMSVLLLSVVSLVAMNRGDKKSLEVGDAIPKFSLTDQGGKTFNVADQIGKHVMVIYFYPKDESMVCTKEACSFRDSFNDFTKAGAIVLGINNGTVASHKHFVEKEKLPFTLLSDPDNKVLKQFGVKGAFFMTGRETFVIDLNGKVAYTYDSMMQGVAHAQQTLAFIQKMNKK
jgi:peroxiredoxin Q/BCP